MDLNKIGLPDDDWDDFFQLAESQTNRLKPISPSLFDGESIRGQTDLQGSQTIDRTRRGTENLKCDSDSDKQFIRRNQDKLTTSSLTALADPNNIQPNFNDKIQTHDDDDKKCLFVKTKVRFKQSTPSATAAAGTKSRTIQSRRLLILKAKQITDSDVCNDKWTTDMVPKDVAVSKKLKDKPGFQEFIEKMVIKNVIHDSKSKKDTSKIPGSMQPIPPALTDIKPACFDNTTRIDDLGPPVAPKHDTLSSGNSCEMKGKKVLDFVQKSSPKIVMNPRFF